MQSEENTENKQVISEDLKQLLKEMGEVESKIACMELIRFIKKSFPDIDGDNIDKAVEGMFTELVKEFKEPEKQVKSVIKDTALPIIIPNVPFKLTDLAKRNPQHYEQKES